MREFAAWTVLGWAAVGITFAYGSASRTVTAAESDMPAEGKATEAAAPVGVTRRNIVRSKLPPEAKVIGLEFTVVKIDSAGRELAVDPEDHSFSIGDSFLVRIRPQDDLYVYVFTEGPEGQRACLLPEDPAEPLMVKQGAEISLPDNGDTFTFEPPAGEEKLVVVAVREPNPDMDRLAEAAFREQGRKLDTQEQERQAGSDPFDRLRKNGGRSVSVRGPSSKAKDPRFLAAVAECADTRGQVIRGPDEATPHSEVFGINKSEIIVDIPLRSNANRTK